MLEEIKTNINNPEVLEELYRSDRKAFGSAFEKIYPEIETTESARFWKARLDFGKTGERTKSPARQEIIAMIVTGLITAILIKIPDLFTFDVHSSFFYERNAAIIVFLGLTLFTIWITRIENLTRLIFLAFAFLIPLIYINLLPVYKSASVNLAYIHLPLLMWCIFGIAYTGFDFKDKGKRIDFIRYNGDLAIIYALIASAGTLLTMITIGLFEAIGMNIQKFYMNNIFVAGAAAAPVVSAFIIRNYTAYANKIAPLIATIFSPLVLLTLLVYLTTIVITGKDPYNDRDFLLVFNIMLIGVMGIIVFSVTETSLIRNQKLNISILFILSIITILIDLIAISAIFYRLGNFGITPNRLAILVSNLLILVNLIIIMTGLFRIIFRKLELKTVELSVANFLPVYLIWIIIVVFGFPVFFGMK
ncbi:MAG: DUF4153 domain-containing protein [Bacteroidota bacterium]|nr:DUF4153 domain-containing protein [Bacteroidota bacterium]